MLCIGSDLVSKIDRYAAEVLSIPTGRLMGNVGVFAAKTLSAFHKERSHILILAGSGNNGGDGYAAAYELEKRGCTTTVFALGAPHSEESRSYAERYTGCGGCVIDASPFANALSTHIELGGSIDTISKNESFCLQYGLYLSVLANADIVIDALLGSGFSGRLRSDAAAILRYINTAFSGMRVAIDLPSGLDGNTGESDPDSFRADMTLSLGLPKRGLYSPIGRELSGDIRHSDIGLPLDKLTAVFSPTDILTDDALVRSLLPKRDRNSSKGNFGRAHLLVGSERYPGAALLAAEASLSAGVGYTVLLAPPAVRDMAILRTPSVIGEGLLPKDFPSFFRRFADTDARKKGALLIGCGLSEPSELLPLLYALFEREGMPLILDADAINALSRDQKTALSRLSRARRDILLTPHPLELSRLTEKSVAEIQKSRYTFAKEFASRYRVTLLLKGYSTLTAAPDGRVFINTTGGTGLSKAGSGDVLAGVITSLAAEGVPLPEAAALGAYLHGAAGDRLTTRYSVYGVRPDDLSRELACVLSDIVNRSEE